MKKGRMLFFIVAMLWLGTLRAFAQTQIPTDVTSARQDCTLLGIEGKYIVQIQEALDRINEIRYEACSEGVKNPSTGKALTLADYVPIRWSADLEYIARIRAAESSLTLAHARTNGSSWNALRSPNGVRSYGEVIAWNWSEKMVTGINQWYSEKSDWVNQVSNAVTGHYTQMIDPNNLYIGMGTFCSDAAEYYNTTVGEFSSVQNLSESRGTDPGACIQILEVKNSYLGSTYAITGTTQTKHGMTVSLNLTTSVTLTDSWGEPQTTKGLVVLDAVSWSSSNPSVAAAGANGQILAGTCGTAVITARDSSGHTATTDLVVDHTWGDWTTASAATVFEAEQQIRTCTVCGASETHTKGKKLKPTLTLSATSLKLNQNQSAAIQVSNLANGDSVVSWKSDNTDIVKVSSTGTITAQKKTGKAYVTVTLTSKKQAVITVTVQAGKITTTKITGVSKKLTLKKGKKKTLHPVITPSNSQDKVTYRTSNKKVATVSKSGVITAKKAGKATITVTSGTKKVTVTVTVK